MKTVEEQLLQMRAAYIKSLYKGQPEVAITVAMKDLHRMNFDSVEDFETYVKDQFQTNPNREATDEEMDAIMGYMGLEGTSNDTRSKEDRDLDEIMLHL